MHQMNDTFCPLPFVNLLMQTDGNYHPCCWNLDYCLGNVQNEDLDIVWNGEQIRKLREEFISGNIVTCKKRITDRGCNRMNHYLMDMIDVDISPVQKKLPVLIDIRLNSECNLKCKMCDVWTRGSGIYNNTFFWNQGREKLFPFLKDITMSGGEPFIQSDMYRLVDIMSEVNPECTWSFSTNGNFSFNDRVRRTLDKIRIRFIQLSLDSLDGRIYPRIRRGGHLDLVMKTLDSLIDYRDMRTANGRPFDFHVSICVQKDNWREVPAFAEFAKIKKIGVEYQYADIESDDSLDTCTKRRKQEILAFFEKHFPGRRKMEIRFLLETLKKSRNYPLAKRLFMKLKKFFAQNIGRKKRIAP